MLLSQAPLAAAPVELSADTAVASAGYFQLRWRADGAVEVQEDTRADFSSARVIYAGADNARVLSGKPDGRWYYRARTAGSAGAFGGAIEVTVRHHPLDRAFAFFAIGALVFLGTLVTIIRGARAA